MNLAYVVVIAPIGTVGCPSFAHGSSDPHERYVVKERNSRRRKRGVMHYLTYLHLPFLGQIQ